MDVIVIATCAQDLLCQELLSRAKPRGDVLSNAGRV
eukprot:COSAG05_NODE_16404_length_347_cov_0.451613_1_plen_35_part_10